MFILMFVNNRKPLGTVCQHNGTASHSVHSHNPLTAFLASPNTRDFQCSFILPFNFVKKNQDQSTNDLKYLLSGFGRRKRRTEEEEVGGCLYTEIVPPPTPAARFLNSIVKFRTGPA